MITFILARTARHTLLGQSWVVAQYSPAVQTAGVLNRNSSDCWCSAQRRFILLVFCTGTVHIAGVLLRNSSYCWCSAQERFTLLVFCTGMVQTADVLTGKVQWLVAYTVNVQVTAGCSTYKQLRSLVFYTEIYHWCPKGEHSDHWCPTGEHSCHW